MAGIDAHRRDQRCQSGKARWGPSRVAADAQVKQAAGDEERHRVDQGHEAIVAGRVLLSHFAAERFEKARAIRIASGFSELGQTAACKGSARAMLNGPNSG
jgi:hypothetical protein